MFKRIGEYAIDPERIEWVNFSNVFLPLDEDEWQENTVVCMYSGAWIKLYGEERDDFIRWFEEWSQERTHP